jgi:Na+-transporting methylmalonyl-CoA/oxaloacetate decarboxylase gamma subunit
MTLLLLADIGGWEAVVEHHGIALSITGMAIVFVALVVIALFIAALPHALALLGPYAPKIEKHGGPSPAEQDQSDEEEVVAAIGFVLHSEARRVGAT